MNITKHVATWMTKTLLPTSNIIFKRSPMLQVSRFKTVMTQHSFKSVFPSTHFFCQRFLSTEVDQELHNFLSKEIALEKEQLKDSQVHKIDDFTVTTAGPKVTFTKKLQNETIQVKFDINDAVTMDSPLAGVGQEEEMPSDSVCKPPFVVEISNSTEKTLSIQCSFPPSDEFMDEEVEGEEQQKAQDTQPENQDGMYDLFEIDEVAIYEGEMTENIYSHHSSVMDGNLYELLMDMLDERGINSEFIEQMTQYSTSYEHNKYVTFLEQLKSFINPK